MKSIIIKRVLCAVVVGLAYEEYDLYLMPKDPKNYSFASFVPNANAFSLEEANKKAKEIKKLLNDNWEVRIIRKLLQRIT